MKKFALSIAALCGLGFAGVSTGNAADWYGGNRYDNYGHTTVVKKYDTYCSTPVYSSKPVYNSKWNDGCFPTPVVRKPVHNHNCNNGWNDRYDYQPDYRYEYRRPVGPSKGFGFNTPDVNFWYGR